MTYRWRDLIYLAVAIVIAGVGYFLFRGMYFASETIPFAQEIVLVFLGAVATIYLTASLLNRQTELELRKEGRVIVLQQKPDVYMSCIEQVAEIVEEEQHNSEMIDQLRVLVHKLAVIGSSEGVTRFTAVLDRLLAGLSDRDLSGSAGEKVMEALAELTLAMRQDLLQEIGYREDPRGLNSVKLNSKRMEILDDINQPEEPERSTRHDKSKTRP